MHAIEIFACAAFKPQGQKNDESKMHIGNKYCL